MASEGKVRKGFYIEEDLLEQMDGLLEQADEVKRINGAVIFEEAYEYQKG